MSHLMYRTQCTLQELAAYMLAKEQHAPSVSPFMGHDYKIHYRRADGSIVPDYDFFLKLAYEGKYYIHGREVSAMEYLEIQSGKRQ